MLKHINQYLDSCLGSSRSYVTSCGRFHEKQQLSRGLWLRKREKTLCCQGAVLLKKAAVEEMSAVSAKERDKRKSKARIEQNIGGKKKLEGSRERP